MNTVIKNNKKTFTTSLNVTFELERGQHRRHIVWISFKGEKDGYLSKIDTKPIVQKSSENMKNLGDQIFQAAQEQGQRWRLTQAVRRPVGRRPNPVKPPRTPVLPPSLKGKGFTAELIDLEVLSAKELKDWHKYNLDTCQVPGCKRASTYFVQPKDADADKVFCLPCTKARLGLE